MGKRISSGIINGVLLISLFVTIGWSSVRAQNNNTNQWIDLFNGKNLDNWIIKFTGHKLGENYNNTFRVENGLLKVSYDNWKQWNGDFGHLFYDKSFSHYILRVQYRFKGKQVKGGAGWAFRNNGIMLHSQDPRTMTIKQDFPVSIEAQLLGGNGTEKRSNLNVCTPGTNIVMDGKLIRQHCTNSSSKTYNGNSWVTVEIEVRGSEIIKHKINGKVVLKYTQPQLDKQDNNAQRIINTRDSENLLLDKGYISLQAESHPTEFKKIQIKVLKAAPKSK